jgi:nucleoporin POM152
LLNNTNPSILRYSLTPLGHAKADAAYFDLNSKDLKSIEKSRLEGLQIIKPTTTLDVSEYDDEYDDDDDDGVLPETRSHSSLQKTQTLIHIRLSKPGTVRLETIIDASNTEARIVSPSEVIIAPCPYVEFVATPADHQNIRCAGQNPDAQLMLDISGVPPLSLRWFKTLNGRRENFNVQAGTGDEKIAQKLRVPLAISLDATGTHTYGLEEVMDGVGNVVQVNTPGELASEKSPSLRSFQVLRRPSMSFKHCSPGNPTAILVGMEAPLSISANEADDLDAPWEVSLKYQPPSDDEKEAKRFKAWTKTLTTHPNRKELTVRATAPGFYTIAGVKGKVRRNPLPCVAI